VKYLESFVGQCGHVFFSPCSILVLLLLQLDILEYIHDMQYVHADIKASNLLLGYTDPQQVSLYSVIILT